MFPGRFVGKQALPAVALALAVGGCGGVAETDAPQDVRGPTYSFLAPAGWQVTRTGRTLLAADEDSAVAVSTFRLARAYTPALWEEASAELDTVAEKLAAELGGAVTRRGTRILTGRRARFYELSGTRDSTQRVVFLLRGRREYQILCRWRSDPDAGREACELALTSFIPA